MDPILGGLLLGGAFGGAKAVGGAAKNASDKKVAATTAKWSPWTGAHAEVRKTDPVGDIASSTLLGGSLGKGGLLGGMGGATSPQSLSPWAAASKLGVDTTMPQMDPNDFFSKLYGSP